MKPLTPLYQQSPVAPSHLLLLHERGGDEAVWGRMM